MVRGWSGFARRGCIAHRPGDGPLIRLAGAMIDLVAFVKPVLDEITGQDVRTWMTGQRVVTANWQIPDAGSLAWSARTLEIEMAQEVAEQLSSADQRALYQLQRSLDRFLRARLGVHCKQDRPGKAIAIVVDRLMAP